MGWSNAEHIARIFVGMITLRVKWVAIDRIIELGLVVDATKEMKDSTALEEDLLIAIRSLEQMVVEHYFSIDIFSKTLFQGYTW